MRIVWQLLCTETINNWLQILTEQTNHRRSQGGGAVGAGAPPRQKKLGEV